VFPGMPNRKPGLAEATREREEASRDAALTTARCLLCPGWVHVGTALEGRTAAREHRLKEHPELRSRRRRSSRGLGGWTSYLHPEDEAELRAERQRRMRLLGLEVDG
jgi:hypothetical protein